MKTIFSILIVLSTVATATPQKTSIDVSNRRPMEMADTHALKTYASENNYYFTPHLVEGMKVLYSASYGIGGEEAQASGTIVQRDGKFWFKQDSNPSQNLLLPPGLPFNSSDQVSLWDLGAYMALVNRVAFSEANCASETSSDVYGKPDAALVDFTAGTAGDTVSYTNALEVKFQKTVGSQSNSNLLIYYAKGIGPVTLEFRENMEPAGTFKFYLGRSN